MNPTGKSGLRKRQAPRKTRKSKIGRFVLAPKRLEVEEMDEQPGEVVVDLTEPTSRNRPAKLRMERVRCAVELCTDEVIKQSTPQGITERLRYLGGLYDKMEEAVTAAILESNGSESTQELDRSREEISEKYLTRRAELMTHQASSHGCTVAAADGKTIQIHVTEPLGLPRFSGRSSQWNKFRSIFEAEIHHNKSYSATQKRSMLLRMLTGKAADVFTLNFGKDETYEEIWKEICLRYGSKQRTVREQLRKITNLGKMNRERSLQEIADSGMGAFRQLQQLCTSEKASEFMMLKLMELTLDETTLAQWEIRQSMEELPTLAQFLSFVEWRKGTRNDEERSSRQDQPRTRGIEYRQSPRRETERRRTEPTWHNKGKK